MTIHPKDIAAAQAAPQDMVGDLDALADAARPHPTRPTPGEPDPADDPASTPPPSAQRHDGWTRARQVIFLQALAATHSVAAAAKEAGMSRQSAYRLRTRLRGEPFDMAWDAAFQTSFDALTEAAMDRAINGVEVPHYHGGELVGTSRRFDERLTVSLLEMRHAPRRRAKPQWHPASDFSHDDFRRYLTRVEHGALSWLPEIVPEDDDGDEYDEDGDGDEYGQRPEE